jgi:hypothetical protein
MRCIATVAVGFVALTAPASAQDGSLKAALTACMTQAATHPLPQMLDVDNAAAVVYACEGQPALELFTVMEPVSNQTIEGDVIARRAGSIVCSSHKSHGLMICTVSIKQPGPSRSRRANRTQYAPCHDVLIGLERRASHTRPASLTSRSART